MAKACAIAVKSLSLNLSLGSHATPTSAKPLVDPSMKRRDFRRFSLTLPVGATLASPALAEGDKAQVGPYRRLGITRMEISDIFMGTGPLPPGSLVPVHTLGEREDYPWGRARLLEEQMVALKTLAGVRNCPGPSIGRALTTPPSSVCCSTLGLPVGPKLHTAHLCLTLTQVIAEGSIST